MSSPVDSLSKMVPSKADEAAVKSARPEAQLQPSGKLGESDLPKKVSEDPLPLSNKGKDDDDDVPTSSDSENAQNVSNADATNGDGYAGKEPEANEASSRLQGAKKEDSEEKPKKEDPLCKEAPGNADQPVAPDSLLTKDKTTESASSPPNEKRPPTSSKGNVGVSPVKKLKKSKQAVESKSVPHKKSTTKKTKMPGLQGKTSAFCKSAAFSSAEAVAQSVVAAARSSDSLPMPRTKDDSEGKAASIPYDKLNITQSDVLLGRGKRATLWKGNINYKKLICAYVPAYEMAQKNKDKTQITVRIVDHIHMLGGRFLKENVKTGELTEVSDITARLKVGQALRHRMRQDGREEGDRSDDDSSESNSMSNSNPRSLSKQNERAYAKIIGGQNADRLAREDNQPSSTNGNLHILLEAMKYERTDGPGANTVEEKTSKKKSKKKGAAQAKKEANAHRNDAEEIASFKAQQGMAARAVHPEAMRNVLHPHLGGAMPEDPLVRAALQRQILQEDPRMHPLLGVVPPQIPHTHLYQASQEVALQRMLLEKELIRKRLEQEELETNRLGGASEDAVRAKLPHKKRKTASASLKDPEDFDAPDATKSNLELLQKLQQQSRQNLALGLEAQQREQHLALQLSALEEEQAFQSLLKGKARSMPPEAKEKEAHPDEDADAVADKKEKRKRSLADTGSVDVVDHRSGRSQLHVPPPLVAQSMGENKDGAVVAALKHAAQAERAQKIRDHYRQIQELERAAREDEINFSVAAAMQRYGHPAPVAARLQAQNNDCSQLMQQALEEQARKSRALGVLGGTTHLDEALAQRAQNGDVSDMASLEVSNASRGRQTADALKSLYPEYFQDRPSVAEQRQQLMLAAAARERQEALILRSRLLEAQQQNSHLVSLGGMAHPAALAQHSLQWPGAAASKNAKMSKRKRSNSEASASSEDE